MSASQQWDVIVIGSGAGGGAVARRLSEAGMKVLVLEKGPRYQPDDYHHDELAHVHRPFFTPDLMRDPHLVTTRKTTTPVRMKLGWSASCVGGGTEHMGAYLYRFHPYDFDQRSRYGAYQDLVDWPLGYDELEPYYVQAEHLLGIAGDGTALQHDYAPRSAPLPLPALRSHPVTTALEAAIREQGMTPSPTPRAINSQPYADRPACQYCPRCGNYGCPIEARGTSQAALLKPAQASGRCEIRSQCMVSEITL
ncbi:MAG TPA: GMC family oxidoreductase, partial [Kiloniellaceae bacterium]|nr:GMC family oxidoreductase [Kiloniellaceae bacterium]